jgi:hypothetical protein
MKSLVVKRSILLAGHETSVSIEERTIRGTMNNAPRHKSKARANVHRHESNYSLTTTASSARILGCLNASTNR